MASEGDIPGATAQILADYNKLRGHDVKEEGLTFWDLVVVTAADEFQAQSFEQQIDDKLMHGKLPRGIPYHVFHDPPGPKAGCGGSTMAVISSLQNMYGQELEEKRVLLLVAGGQSQRLPSASILGKIFSPLPVRQVSTSPEKQELQTTEKCSEEPKATGNGDQCKKQEFDPKKASGDSLMQQLDLKLATCTPFLSRMQPGFFHSAADTIEVYDLGGEEEEWSFKKPGFTAVAHPSALDVGTRHGVYILGEREDKKPTLVESRHCIEVLHTPSVELMRKKGAIHTRSTTDGGKEEAVYTDSAFFFDHEVANILCDFYEEFKPIDCEIDSYGDFLQALGKNATESYTNDIEHVSNVEPDLVEMRQKIFELLKGTPLHIVLLNASKFYHLGSMEELLDHFCDDSILAKELGFDKHVLTSIVPEASETKAKRARQEGNLDGCLMHNCLTEGSNVDKSSVVEFCHFSVPCHVGERCIISKCEYVEDDLEKITILPNTFLHTVIVRETPESPQLYATVFFSTKDDIKNEATSETVEDLPYLGTTLKSLSTAWKLGDNLTEIVFPHSPKLSLWNARLFPAKASMSESFKVATELLDAARGGSAADLSDQELYSMADLAQLKDTQGMLDYRERLFSTIIQ